MMHGQNDRKWAFGNFCRTAAQPPLFMGIVNVTPDSFSDGGRFLSSDVAVEHGLKLVEEGADILDIGGESTRPYSEPVSLVEELNRVIPVVERLSREVQVPISIDTSKPDVARAALQAGATIVNDIAGLRDPRMLDVCREFPCGIVCMHMRGTPATMQNAPHYENVVTDIFQFFEERLQTMANAGIAAERIAFDPGVGFGKTAEHNIQILSSMGKFQELGRPILVGHSRKGFLKKVLGRSVDERLFGTIGVSLALADQRVDILRVHDIAANRDAVTAFLTVTGSIRQS